MTARTIHILVGVGVLTAGLGIRAADPNKIVIDGSTTVGPIAKAFAEYYMGLHPEVNITVSESGSGNGAKSLINAVCDIASMSRPMKPSEKKSAEEAGRLPIEHVIAYDGLSVVVHKSNPVSDLTLDQIRDIYLGKIRNWKELGGPDAKIVAISRETNSGTYETFESIVMRGEKMAPSVQYLGSNGAVRQQVLQTPHAIGYVGMAFTEGLKPLRVNGVAATPETVLDRSYPIARPLYFYTNGRPKKGTHLAAFVELYRTEEGRRIIEDCGFIPVPTGE